MFADINKKLDVSFALYKEYVKIFGAYFHNHTKDFKTEGFKTLTIITVTSTV